jgi:hypothetical protein
MSIPTIVTPTYEIKLHSISRPVKYRPYLVKEEKILLMAQEGKDETEIDRAVKQIVQNCTFDAINADTLPTFDLEFLFLNLRAKSVNNLVELRYECKNKPVSLPLDTTVDGLCHNIEVIKINLDDIKLVVPKGHTKKVMLTDIFGCVMRYPTSKYINVFDNTNPEVDSVALIANCIESIFETTGEVHEAKDSTPEELRTFVESLPVVQANKFRVFFDTMPRLEHTFQFKCTKCDYTEDITLSGIMDFFV